MPRSLEQMPSEDLGDVEKKPGSAEYIFEASVQKGDELKKMLREDKEIKKEGAGNYYYEAMDAQGKEVEGTVDAQSDEEAEKLVRSKGYFVTKIKAIKE